MSKPLSLFLLILAASMVGWRGTEAMSKLWTYLRLDTEVNAKIETWHVEELSPSKYALVATFAYSVQGNEKKGQDRLPPPFYPNRYAAIDAMAGMSTGETKVWVNHSHPEFTSLQRTFPVLSFFYTFSSLAILLYFLYIIQFSAGAIGKPFGKK